MKTIKTFALAILLTLSTGVYAQFANSQAVTTSTSSVQTTTEIPSTWSTFFVSYDTPKFTFDDDDFDFDGGFTVGVLSTSLISESMPLFIESGGSLSYVYFSEEEKDYDYEVAMTYLYLTIPVSVVYNFQIDEKISIIPYAGLNVRVGLIGNESYEYDGESEDYSWFDEDDLDEDEVFSRFTLGYQIGANVKFNNYIFGLKYQNDMTEIADEMKFNSFSVCLGYCF